MPQQPHSNDLDDDLPSGDAGPAELEFEAEPEPEMVNGVVSPRSGTMYDVYYENYLMVYSLYGRGRPKLNRERYEELDRELLRLVAGSEDPEADAAAQLTRKNFNRIRELEYVLLDDVTEALLDPGGRTSAKARATPPAEGESEQRQSLAFHWSDDSRGLTP
jgi:hypothetical protein